MEKSNAIQIINSRKLITEPGKFAVKVTGITPYTRPDTDILTNIVNFAAMTPYQLGEAKRLLREGLFQEATNQNLTSSQRIGQDFQPDKGEIVNIVVDYIKTTSGENALLVVSVSEMKTKNTFSINLLDEDEMEDGAATTEEGEAREHNVAAEQAVGAEDFAEASLVNEEAPVAEVEQPAGV